MNSLLRHALGMLALIVMPACADSGSKPANAGGSAATPGSNAAGEASGGNSGGGSGSGSGSVDFTARLPVPLTSNQPRPNARVSAPNLRVLPWAGFAAALTYTFDDTQPSQTEHWAELAATQVRMTFFANPVNNWQAGFDAAWSAVRASGSEIGNHTWSHCHADLSGCTPIGTADEEVDRATTYIIEHFGAEAVYSFAAPFGEVGWNSLAPARFLLARGVSGGIVASTGAVDWYDLPVYAVTEGQRAGAFNAAIDSARRQGGWNIFLFHSLLPSSNNWYAGVDIGEVTSSIEHAKSLGDVWVDTITEIGAYRRAQQMFEELNASDGQWTWTLPEHFPPGKVLRVSVDGGALSQNGAALAWDPHGYYTVDLDAGSLTWTP